MKLMARWIACIDYDYDSHITNRSSEILSTKDMPSTFVHVAQTFMVSEDVSEQLPCRHVNVTECSPDDRPGLRNGLESSA